MFVDGPPKVRPGAPMPATADCTSSSVMPIVDIIMGTASTVAILEVFPNDVDGIGSIHIAMLAYPLAHFGSSVQGFRRTSACKTFLATPMERQTPQAVSVPPTLPPTIPFVKRRGSDSSEAEDSMTKR